MLKRRDRIFIATGVCLFNCLIFYNFLSPLRNTPVYDLPNFYFAGKLVRSGQISRIYDTGAYRPLIEDLRRTNPRSANHSLYFNRPAFEAPLFLPLAFFSFQTARELFVATNFVLLGLLVWLLPKWYPSGGNDRMWLFVYMPFLYSVIIGQDTLLFTLLLAYAFHLALEGRDVAAGVILALAAFKPHLLAALPLAMVASRRWRLLTSFLTVGAAVEFASYAMVGWHGLQQWMLLLQAPTTDFVPWMMGNVRALGIHLGRSVSIFGGCVSVIAFALTLKTGEFKHQFAAAILVALVLSPHTYLQDYSALSLVALVALHPVMKYSLLLPWPYFYPMLNRNLIPFIFLAIACQVSLPARKLVKRLKVMPRFQRWGGLATAPLLSRPDGSEPRQ